MPESTRHRQAFEQYWGLGPARSLDGLHDVLARAGRAPHLRTLAEWSRAFHWQSQIAETEVQARRTNDQARDGALLEMAERHTKEALLLQQVGRPSRPSRFRPRPPSARLSQASVSSGWSGANRRSVRRSS